ncbi:hypothetical protein GFM44_37920 [Rhizobium leguminosarum bv. viciae]|nr:hypothetical protein [Rhizobium leguminosarum bv. viciae]
MKLTFPVVATTAATICLVLAGLWIFSPRTLLFIWSVNGSDATDLVARRGGALFLGLGVLLIFVRNSGEAVGRYAVAVGLAVGCSALATLGCYELLSGHAGVGILLAVAVEAALAISFVCVRHGDI